MDETTFDFRRGMLKRSRNFGSGASASRTKLLLSDGCSAQTKAAVCLSDTSSLTLQITMCLHMTAIVKVTDALALLVQET